ncbi:MAG: lipoprotein-releasing ABC transporter permease subunit [Desulfovibrionaceae bacterium]|jgi:lipoprotein-releasing system permease protein|nr:lipoprotein-releasing ABC transporter permease subunit [Desulfovibrionaceae bacterium]
MRFELFVALRYLLARRKQTFISVISLISVLGVALGVASLIVVIGVMNGFTTQLREKLLSVTSHVVVLNIDRSLDNYDEVASTVRAVDGVTGVTPFTYAEVMISSGNRVKGLVLRGLDPATSGTVIGLDKEMVHGHVADLGSEGPVGDTTPGLIVGAELAKNMGLSVGSRVNLLSPAGRRTAAGFAPRILAFRVVGIFKTGLYEYDSTLGYVTLAQAGALMGMPKGRVTGLEVRVADVFAADRIAGRIVDALGGFPYSARDWIEMNANLFAALQLEKTAMFVILTLIVLVGSFSIITTLIMLVMEKTRDIAILMSMGATARTIRRIFMLQGTIIGLLGTTLGYGLGIGASLLLKRYQFIKLPEGVYPMDRLPVLLEWPDLALIGGAAMLLCFLATLYPARQAAGLEPAEALRYE